VPVREDDRLRLTIYRVNNYECRCRASSEDTGGAYSLTDSLAPPEGGPPPHTHNREDETFWMLEENSKS